MKRCRVRATVKHEAARYVLAIACAGYLIVAAPARSAAQSELAPRDDARTLMQRVAAAYAQNVRGILGVRSQSALTIKAPVFRRRIADATWFVFVDGTLVQSGKDRDPRQPPLRDPYRKAFLADYDYTYLPCATCDNETVTIAYESRYHDVEHASGRLVIDMANAQIVSETEKPYKLPWPTQDGHLEATWGRAGGGWFPLTITGEFVGRIGPFVGHAEYAQALSSYERFTTVESAANTLSLPVRTTTAAASDGSHAQR